jgi:hypothetical protein
MPKDNKLWIDMCAGSELKDTQGETLSVEGADIEDLQSGKGRLNDNHGKGFFNSLGRVTEAKKIFKSEDCDNERHKYYWEKIKAPFIYAKGYLFSDEDHPNAKAAAAILRNIHREDAPLVMKASVEGGVVARGTSDPSRLARTKIHSVALTFTPANNATLVEPINLNKNITDWEEDKQLIKSVMHLAETNVPSFRHIQRHASANSIIDNISKIKEISEKLGIDVPIELPEPEVIMKNAVMRKIQDNILKINQIVKSVKVDQIKMINAESAKLPDIANQDLEKSQNIKNKLKKALLAGYGGAGAPTDMTGGGVIQPQSLDAKRKKKVKNKLIKAIDLKTQEELNKNLDYVTCDDCGHEQVLMPYQVRCRQCRKNFSLHKLNSSHK